MTNARIGHGSQWQRGDGADQEVFTALAEVTSINGISVTADTVDATHMGSPGAFEEVIASIIRTGEITIEMNFDPASTTTTNAKADVESRAARNYKWVTPDGGYEWIVPCIATGFEIGVPLDDKMTGTATYKPTGQPSYGVVA